MLTRYRRSRQRTFIPSDIVLSVYVYVNLTGQAYRIATAILGVAVDVMDFPAWRPAMRPLRIFLVIAIPVFHQVNEPIAFYSFGPEGRLFHVRGVLTQTLSIR